MKHYFKTSTEAHKERDRRQAKSSVRIKVFKVRGRYFVGTDSEWLLAVS